MVNTSGPQASIGNGQTMNEDAAAYFNALCSTIARETGYNIVATEGTRTYDRQKYLYDGWVNRKRGFNPAYSPTSPYAYHLSGRAVDVGSSVGYVNTPQSRAFYARAGHFGFRATVSGEPWHFEWQKRWATVNISQFASSDKIVFPDTYFPERDEDMYRYLVISPTGQPLAYVKVTQYRHDIISEAAMQKEYAALGKPWGELPRVAQDVDVWLTSEVEREKEYAKAAQK